MIKQNLLAAVMNMSVGFEKRMEIGIYHSGFDQGVRRIVTFVQKHSKDFECLPCCVDLLDFTAVLDSVVEPKRSTIFVYRFSTWMNQDG